MSAPDSSPVPQPGQPSMAPPAVPAPPAADPQPAPAPPGYAYAAAPYPPPYAPAPGGVPPASPGPAPFASDSQRPHRGWIGWLIGLLVVAALVGMSAWAVSVIGRGAPGLGAGRTIAVIPFEGAIAGSAGATGGTMTPQRFLKLLERAQDDPDVKAIVLRVDSPGGTVAASEEIASYVKNATKPVVVSVSDVDASGAYMVSSQADRIVANPGSAVGSIGVITEIPNVSALMDKVGVQFKVIMAGKYKDAGSPFRALTPQETALIQGQVDQVYEQFVGIVAAGRHMSRADVEKLATGWAWNGDEAKKLGLVDQIGTYQDALVAAAKLGDIKGKYEVVTYDEPQLSGVLSALLGIERQLQNLSAVGSLSPSSLTAPPLVK